MRPTGTAEELERRRLRAVSLLESGRGPTEVGKTVGATRRTVQRWARRAESLGKKGLKAKPHPGRRCRMTPRQKDRLSRMLLKGPKAHGFSTDLWTRKRVAQVIHKRLAVRYHPGHVSRLLHLLGWTPQKPERRAYERDEKAIRTWIERDWPRIKKARRTGAHIVFLDESGFSTTPMVRRTWAPKGRTPILYHLGHRDKVSALSGISVSPRRRRLGLYIRFFENRNVKAPDIKAFLRQLLRHLQGRVIVIWDRGRPHTAKETKRFLHRSRRRLSTESFPSYAPDLNPDEHVWALLKNHRLANHGFNTLQRLHQHLLYHAGRTGRSQSLLWGCIRASELPLEKP